MSIPLVSRVQAWPARTGLLGLAAVIAGLALVLAAARYAVTLVALSRVIAALG